MPEPRFVCWWCNGRHRLRVDGTLQSHPIWIDGERTKCPGSLTHQFSHTYEMAKAGRESLGWYLTESVEDETRRKLLEAF